MQREEKIRKRLKTLYEKGGKFYFTGTFKRFGFYKRFPDRETLLLEDIYLIDPETGEKIEYIADHVWLNKSKRWKNFIKRVERIGKEFSENSQVCFRAEIEPYYKEGKERFFQDYRLDSIREIKFCD